MTNAEFVDKVMACWDRKMNTEEIARALMTNEPLVARALTAGREARRIDLDRIKPAERRP
jgi:hypothetical protein